MIGLVEMHDRAAFQYIAYNYGPTSGASPLVARARSAFEVFHDVGTLSNRDIAKRIAADDIDVLLFLRGPGDARTGVLALRPAPVQLAYLYYPGGFGFPLVDALIADPIVIPPELLHHYSERILHLPRCYQPNDARRPLPQPLSRSEAGLPDGAVVLANFAQSFKITPAAFDVWCRLLREHARCVLWLLDTHPSVVRNLRNEAAARGVDPARLLFAPMADTQEHLSRIACADLILDTWPYGGHTGTSDALWAGVPVVARCGQTFASRVAPSLLHSVGLDELVASDETQYFQIASSLIGNPKRREALRDHLRLGRSTFELFNPAGYARDFEALLARVVRYGVQASAAQSPSA
jgi:predicted O-linked N-acetylglucosamine transferase (SPINDLY family)